MYNSSDVAHQEKESNKTDQVARQSALLYQSRGLSVIHKLLPQKIKIKNVLRNHKLSTNEIQKITLSNDIFCKFVALIHPKLLKLKTELKLWDTALSIYLSWILFPTVNTQC